MIFWERVVGYLWSIPTYYVGISSSFYMCWWTSIRIPTKCRQRSWIPLRRVTITCSWWGMIFRASIHGAERIIGTSFLFLTVMRTRRSLSWKPITAACLRSYRWQTPVLRVIRISFRRRCVQLGNRSNGRGSRSCGRGIIKPATW